MMAQIKSTAKIYSQLDLTPRDASCFRGYCFTLGGQEDFGIVCTTGMQVFKPKSDGLCVQSASGIVLSCYIWHSYNSSSVIYFIQITTVTNTPTSHITLSIICYKTGLF